MSDHVIPHTQTDIYHLLEVPFKKSLVVAAVVALCVLTSGTALAQASASQTVSFSVNPIYRMTVSGDPAPLVITAGTVGVDNLTSVSNSATTYSIMQNVANTVKITADLDAAMPAGYTLAVARASGKGTPAAGAVDISNGNPADVVTAIGLGADAGRMITYTFSAIASAGQLATTTRMVTFTLTD